MQTENGKKMIGDILEFLRGAITCPTFGEKRGCDTAPSFVPLLNPHSSSRYDSIYITIASQFVFLYCFYRHVVNPDINGSVVIIAVAGGNDSVITIGVHEDGGGGGDSDGDGDSHSSEGCRDGEW